MFFKTTVFNKMMHTRSDLVTNYSFRGKEFVVSVNLEKPHCGKIEVNVTCKKTSESWKGVYDATYIENLTQKTGNYKRFDTFVSMLKSGLLGTSHCVSLDLLTFEDLEMLRNKTNHASQLFTPSASNRRYLILTYTVEFDRIHYPLSLEYCGLPDPKVLQETILRLEKQVADLQQQLTGSGNNWADVSNQLDLLQKKVVDVTTENLMLKGEIKRLNQLLKTKQCCKETNMLIKSVYCLENKLKTECENMDKIMREKKELTYQLNKALKSEKALRAQLNSFRIESQIRNKTAGFSRKASKSADSSILVPFNDNHTLRKSRFNNLSRKIHSARSYNSLCNSSDSSVVGGSDRGKQDRGDCQVLFSPRPRAVSPSFSDLSHNSGLSRCACRNCLNKIKKDIPDNMKKQGKRLGKVQLLKRIQSLEKLISNALV